MPDPTISDRSEEEKEASAAKLRAEEQNLLAEARKNAAQAEHHEYEAELARMRLELARENERIRMADDFHNFTYRFNHSVTTATARAAVEQLIEWHRLDPTAEIIFHIDSPGGGIIEGFHLYDTIMDLRGQGHKVITVSRGMAASMGGVLLQAGDQRLMGKRASMLIHEAQFGAIGTWGEVEDQVEFVKKLQDRILDILSERSKMTKQQIKRRWSRTNWWLSAEEALEHGFIDGIV